jgi:hypothetical protein
MKRSNKARKLLYAPPPFYQSVTLAIETIKSHRSLKPRKTQLIILLHVLSIMCPVSHDTQHEILHVPSPLPLFFLAVPCVAYALACLIARCVSSLRSHRSVIHSWRVGPAVVPIIDPTIAGRAQLSFMTI